MKHLFESVKVDFSKYNKNWLINQKKIQKKELINGHFSFYSLHNAIKKSTKIIPQKSEELFNIIQMIHIWGGHSGHYFIRVEKFYNKFRKDKKQIKKYREAAKMARDGNYDALETFCQIPGIGIAFGSKHAYFWSSSRNPMIIIDRFIASYFQYDSPIKLVQKNAGYKKINQAFLVEAKRLNLKNSIELERGIFQYMRENK